MEKSRSCYLAVVLLSLCWVACGILMRDSDIKQMLVAGSKGETAFAAVNFLVKDGVVTLTGTSASEKERGKVAERVMHTSGVKKVINKLAVGTITLDGDFPLQKAADSALTKYPAVLVNVQDSIILVSGTARQEEMQELLDALNKLSAKGVQVQVTTP